jgi:hypothetical protein
VRDLSPLKGMPLTALSLHNCSQLRDLSPIKGMQLTSLQLGGWVGTPVRDLSPIRGMPLKELSIELTGVTDLTPLQGMALETITLTPTNITRGLKILRDMDSLKTIGLQMTTQSWPPAEFWARYDKGEFKK